MELFDLRAKISLDSSEYDSGLEKASGKMGSFAAKLESAYSGVKSALSPAVKGFQGIEKVGKTAGTGIINALKGFGVASTAVAGFGGSAVQAGMSFDAAMSQVSAVSGATGENFEALRNKAIEMGAKTQFSATEAAEAMNYMAMAGWKTEDMLGGISGVMNLAAASGEELATTSDIVTDALTAFKMPATESGRLANVLAAASSNANTNVGMMGETFKYVAPIAGSLNYSIEDVSFATGLMANSSIKASQAGTSLRSIMTRLATNAGASKTQLGALDILTERLGVNFYDASGHTRDFTSVLMEAREAWKDLGDEEIAFYSKQIAGQEAMSGWLAIMNAADEDVEKLSTAIKTANDGIGAAAKMSATMMDNLAGDIKLFKSALESLQISVSDTLTPTLREFTQFGTKAIEELTTGFQEGGLDGFFSALTGIVTQAIELLAEKAPEFVNVSLKFVESLATGILDAKDSILQSFNECVNILLTGVGAWLGEHGEELVQFGLDMVDAIFQGFSQAGDLIAENIGTFIPLIADAFLSYHESLVTVGLNILGAIGRGITENQDKLQEMASQTIQNMVTAFAENAPDIIDGAIALLEALVGAIVENLPLITDSAVEIVSHLAVSIGEALPTLIPAAVEAVVTFVENLTSPGNLTLLIDGALQLITGLVEGILKALPKLIAAAPVIIINLVTGLIANLPKIFEAAVEIILALAKGLIQAIPELLKAIPQIIMALIEAIVAFVVNFVEAGADLIMALGEGIADAWEGIMEFFGGALERLVSFLSKAWETIKAGAAAAWEAISGVFQAAWDVVVKIWEAAGGFFSGIWEAIQGAFAAVVDFFGDIFTRAWEAIKSVWDAVAGFFSGIAEGIRNVFSTVMEAVAGFFQAAWDAVQAMWEAAVDFFSGVWEGIQAVFSVVADVLGGFFSAAWEAVTEAWQVAGEFYAGIWEAIVNVFQGVAEWFGNLFSKAWEAVTSAWAGVGSFFSGIWEMITGAFSGAWDTFASIGKNIVQGLWSGVQALAGWLWGKISGWVQSIWDGVLNFFGIHSPSKKFEWAMKMNVEGSALGFDKYGYKAVDSVKSLGEDISSAFNSSLEAVRLPDLQGSISVPVPYRFPSEVSAEPNIPSASSSPTTVIINSPKAVDAIQAAREWKKTTQRLAMGY